MSSSQPPGLLGGFARVPAQHCVCEVTGSADVFHSVAVSISLMHKAPVTSGAESVWSVIVVFFIEIVLALP